MVEKKKGPCTLSDKVRASLAIFIVYVGMGSILAVWAIQGAEDGERLAAVLLGVIGSVTGYYFGKQGLDKAQDQADRASAEKKKIETRTAYFDEIKKKADTFAVYAEKYLEIVEAAKTDTDLDEKIKKALGQI